VAVAALLVVAVLTAPAWRTWLPTLAGPSGRVQPEVGPVPGPEPSGATVPPRSVRCEAGSPGDGPPVEFLRRPAGLAGPVDGPAPGAPPATGADQQVFHYPLGEGAVEVRWPPDRPAGDAGGGDSIPIDPGGPGGPVARASLATGVPGACESVEVAWWGTAPTDFANTAATEQYPGDTPFARAARTLYTMLTPAGTGDLVLPESTSSPGTAPAGVPDVLPCEEADPPVASGTESAPAPQPDPESALSSWLNTAPPELATSGYERLDVAPDLVAFAKPYEDGGGYVTVAVATRVGDGWAVTSWQASGC
jgi:hypothetical protein